MVIVWGKKMSVEIFGFILSLGLALFCGALATAMLWPLVCLALKFIYWCRYGENYGSPWLVLYLGKASQFQAKK